MAKILEENSITIPKHTLLQGGAVILPLKDYRRLLSYEMEREEIDRLVDEGLAEKQAGKTETLAKFLKREYPKLYASYKN